MYHVWVQENGCDESQKMSMNPLVDPATLLVRSVPDPDPGAKLVKPPDPVAKLLDPKGNPATSVRPGDYQIQEAFTKWTGLLCKHCKQKRLEHLDNRKCLFEHTEFEEAEPAWFKGPRYSIPFHTLRSKGVSHDRPR